MSTLTFDKLIIRNFKSFRGKHVFQLKRSTGLYYISGINKVEPELGANGVGKTSLWDALTWCLFGKTGKDNRPGEAITPWGEKVKVKVILRFSRGKKYYSIIRTRHPNSLKLKEEEGIGETTQNIIEETVGVSEEMFRRSIVLAQFGTLFMDMRPEQQSQMFNEALDLDVWLEASERASKARKGFESEVAANGLLQMGEEGKLLEIRKSIKQTKLDMEQFESNLAGNLREHKKVLDDSQHRLKNLLKKYPDIKEQISKNNKKSTRLKDERLEILAKEHSARDKYSRLEKEIAEYKRSLETSKPVCQECGQKVSVKHIQDKVIDKVFELKKVEAKMNEYNMFVSQFDYKLNEQEKEFDELIEIQKKIDKRESYIALLKEKLAELSRTENIHIEGLTKLRLRRNNIKVELNKYIDKVDEAAKAAKICEYWIGAFKEIRLNLIDQVLDEMGMVVTKHAESLGLQGWMIKFNTERETKTGNVTTVFSVVLYPPGQEKPVKWESYSGGESQRWQLAVAFGLSEIVLARAGIMPNIEALDEPTKGLSPEGVEALLEHLNTRAKELNRSIYLTEHHSLERGLFDGKIIVQKNDEGSQIIET